MYKRTVLDNGLRIVCENIPYVRSISLGIWVGTGSRNETIANSGISHFIEHMLFKGTKNRTAKEIAQSIDNIGGQLNAFTGKECTCYYTKTLDSDIDIAIEVLADMMFNSNFSKKDIDIERKVILEEIGMYEDYPEEMVHDILSETVWKDNSLGYPILGTSDSLKLINKDLFNEYMIKNYTPDNCVISVVGNFDYEKLVHLITKYFGDWKSDKELVQGFEPSIFTKDIKIKQKDTEQVHVCLGFNGIEHGKDELYTLLAINNILGGGMSSRLFQKIREQEGLVYSIYSYPSSYKDAGLFTIYAGMNPEQYENVLNLICLELNLLLEKGISEDDLEKSKNQLKGSYILGLESTSSRMNSIGKSELMLEKINTPDKILEKIDEINPFGVRELIKRIFNMDMMSFSAIGKIRNDIDYSKILKF